MTNKAIPIHVPHETLADISVRLSSWLVGDGEHVDSGQTIAEIETSKAILEVPAEATGYIRYNLKQGAEIPVGGVLCYITSSPTDTIPEAPDESLIRDKSQPGAAFSRKAGLLIEHNKLDPKHFEGRGLIRESDVLEFLNSKRNQGEFAASARTMPSSRTLPEHPSSAPFRKESLPPMKQSEISSLSLGQNALTSFVSVACPTRGFRAAVQHYPGLTATPSAIIVYESARLLRKYPIFNSFYDESSANYYEAINVGFAVDGDRGLKVLIIHDADKKDLGGIVNEMQDLLLCYQENKIPTRAFVGGTFTISDLSGEDVFSFRPLINRQQAAILGVGGEFFAPGNDAGICQFILTFDHRLSEGRMAAKFLCDLRDRIESYERALRASNGAIESTCFCSKCLRPGLELESTNAHLVQVIRPDGTKAPICTICLGGW